MNHIKALAIAQSRQQGHLEAARRRHVVRPEKPVRAVRRSYLGAMLRAYIVGFRAKAQPTR